MIGEGCAAGPRKSVAIVPCRARPDLTGQIGYHLQVMRRCLLSLQPASRFTGSLDVSGLALLPPMCWPLCSAEPPALTPPQAALRPPAAQLSFPYLLPSYV